MALQAPSIRQGGLIHHPHQPVHQQPPQMVNQLMQQGGPHQMGGHQRYGGEPQQHPHQSYQSGGHYQHHQSGGHRQQQPQQQPFQSGGPSSFQRHSVPPGERINQGPSNPSTPRGGGGGGAGRGGGTERGQSGKKAEQIAPVANPSELLCLIKSNIFIYVCMYVCVIVYVQL